MLDKKTGALWIGASQLVLLFANFLLLKLLTSNMSIEDFGYYSLCMSIVLFVRQIFYDPMSITVAKKVGASAHDLQQISNGFQIVKFATDRFGLMFLLLGFVIWFFVSIVINRSVAGLAALLCTFYLCANGAQGIYINLFNSVGDRKSAALFSISDSILKIFLVFFLLLIFEIKLIYVLASISTGAFMVFVFMRSCVTNRIVVNTIPAAELAAMVKQSIFLSAPLYLPTLFAAFKIVADRWILTSFTGVGELAAYSVLQQLGYSPILLFFGMAQTFFAPKIFRLSADENDKGHHELKQLLNQILFFVFLFTCVATGIAILVSDWLLQLLTGSAYHNQATYLPIFIVSGAFAATAGILQIVAIGVFEARLVGKLMSATVFVSVAITLFFVINWGLIGSIAALLISSAASALIYWMAIYRKFFKLD